MNNEGAPFFAILFAVVVFGGMLLWASITDPWVSTKTIRKLPYAERVMVKSEMQKIQAPIRRDQLRRIKVRYAMMRTDRVSLIRFFADHHIFFVSPQVIQSLPHTEKLMINTEIQHTRHPLTQSELADIQSVWMHSGMIRQQLNASIS